MPSGVYPRKKKFPAMSMKQLKTFGMASKPYEYKKVELTIEEKVMNKLKETIEFYLELSQDLRRDRE